MENSNVSSDAVRQIAATQEQSAERGWLTITNLEALLNSIELIVINVKTNMQKNALTTAARRRLLGAGMRRYGFISKVSDVAEANPEFQPVYFNNATLKIRLRQIELLRNISSALQQILRINDDVMLQTSDVSFQMALAYYNTVREATRRRQPGAQTIFKLLQQFFRRSLRPSDEPTEQEVERNLHALLHGKKDGKIVIENERPHLTGGKHVVIDETHKGNDRFKETIEGES